MGHTVRYGAAINPGGRASESIVTATTYRTSMPTGTADHGSVPDLPSAFIAKVPKYLEHFKHNVFRMPLNLNLVIETILDYSSQAPNLYSIDTEFARTRTIVWVTEVAISDIKSRRLVADYISPKEVYTKRGQPRRQASLAAARLAGRLSKDSVSTVYTVSDLAKQIEVIKVQTTDIFVENSNRKHADLDLGYAKSVLRAGGFNSEALLPVRRAYCVQIALKEVLSQVFQLSTWSQQLLYRILDPQSPPC
ncbi:hypothetical protein QBC33DRAFT_41309 [Phialemonium atrogriseum]|uniref:Uncharacterized protein n=1 Tax=Phialemonium atrogriseum TaxID=1093897 RepID=A0AAJ0C3G9_9PEZI|nr:uncharacterized protein QBC33DRAFT_41309 [Phialemonium atrogriseum]KAK1768007.1 hypothetical protein QBC33DRAFT_41309 [Phialemonium atrogriseum]